MKTEDDMSLQVEAAWRSAQGRRLTADAASSSLTTSVVSHMLVSKMTVGFL